MQGRLSELLERIRPAGAPGAPNDGDPIRQHPGERELAALLAVLAEYEQEAHAVVEQARADATRLGRDGAHRSQAIRSSLASRVADEEVRTAHAADTSQADADARFDADARGELADLRRRADEELPGLVTEAVELVWTTFLATAAEEGR